MNNPRIKILFLIPSLADGGAERVIVNLLRYLDRTKFALILAVVNLRGAVFLDDVPSDVELIDLNCMRVRFAVFKIIRLLWKLRPQVLFSTLGHLNLLLAILKPLAPKNIRYLCRETTILSEGIKTYAHPHYWKWAHRRFYVRFDKIICQSNYMRDDLYGDFGIPTDKLIVINNPVDVNRIRQLAAQKITTTAATNKLSKKNNKEIINLVSAGRMIKTKGFDLLIQALALCGNPNIHLTLLGDGVLKEELQALAKTLGVEKQISFVGFQNNPYAFIAQADTYVLSSRFEGFPNVVLEALACGTPVIATPAIGGTKEILEDVDGCLIADSISAEGLAQALSNFSFGKRLSPNVVEPYVVNHIIRLYEQQFIQ